MPRTLDEVLDEAWSYVGALIEDTHTGRSYSYEQVPGEKLFTVTCQDTQADGTKEISFQGQMSQETFVEIMNYFTHFDDRHGIKVYHHLPGE